ncbi:hypothetical protein SAMN06269185_0886 [Natronoarchaeum philippinense]|uniref:Uncharacterized protein n=1 Tax=Natronoarchaeum philippinense TaxID=558529 RepID=A0A285N7Z6_NATPI|nr:hypothetical protein [Natronoarchaeum philippinense]SNZ05540.1 hypothetical protein SAMN06269185_0886 [Natronoarchaeum philippinense]
MVTASYVLGGASMFILGAVFTRLGASNDTEELYLQVLEYGFAIAFLTIGAGLVVISLL